MTWQGNTFQGATDAVMQDAEAGDEHIDDHVSPGG